MAEPAPPEETVPLTVAIEAPGAVEEDPPQPIKAKRPNAIRDATRCVFKARVIFVIVSLFAFGRSSVWTLREPPAVYLNGLLLNLITLNRDFHFDFRFRLAL